MTSKNSQPKFSTRQAGFAWATCALFFFYIYILRVTPGVMIDDLRHEFSLTAEQFSTFGAYNLYAYALLQIPIGILVDRLGVRLMVSCSIGLCIMGTILLGYTETLLLAQLSRIMVGAGSATAFMCSLKIAADYFPQGRRGLLMGMTLAIGTIGALSAGKPLVLLLDVIGWRQTILATTLLGIPLLIMGLMLLPTKPTATSSAPKDTQPVRRQLLTIFKNRTVMLYAFLAIGLYTPLSSLADLWGTAFLMQKYELPRASAAQTSMMMYLGMAIGSICLPWFCEKYNILNRGIQVCGVCLFALFTLILYGPHFSPITLVILLLALGFFCGAEMMCFTGALQNSQPQISGLTIGVVNTLNMLGGAILQQVIGFGLDWQWQGAVDAYNVRTYNTEEFVFALTSLLIIMGICCLASLRFNGRKSAAKIG